MTREDLDALTGRFMAAFNDNDLDAVMELFAEDAVYDELNGRRNRGKPAIRAAFEPQFRGELGSMKFIDEDLMLDGKNGKVMTSWRCSLELSGEPTSWRGLDLLHFEDGKIVRKITYGKAKAPLFEKLEQPA